ncbi:DUF4258 domain-containing protein [Bosea sp. NBC_00550]|uniref:DUF4258 domain-containing protein n=1 Tax=Bosea sp. NBC_00550 TaxID=2969621 RepID=UPI0022328BE7|nr:DUF4258 domain-containing protein [Bosea sp. NBC_00550]UZF91965.1 DUF4258 domain-containing protein [Bosea sp. NBC_00550]
MTRAATGAAFEFTNHALAMMAERSIERAWVELTVLEPDQVEPDLRNPEVTRAFRTLPERDGRVLRVVYRRTDTHFRIITMFLDRGRGR